MLTESFKEKFLTNREESGRYIVTSFRTGRSYCVEPIGDGRGGDWGSYNPGTGNIENKKGFDKYTGSVLPKDSLITESNGFETKYIHNLEVGESPEGYISLLDEKYPDKCSM